MAERVLKLKALHCNHRSSGSLIGGKISSILKISKHKKHLSVRFEDQVPMASIKTLINDIDKISTNIELYFPTGSGSGNQHYKDENIMSNFVEVKKKCVKRRFERNYSVNELKGTIKVADKVSSLNNHTVGLNKKFQNLANLQDTYETEIRIVKKKVLPSVSFKVLKHSKNIANGNCQGFYHSSPKIVKQSVHPSIFKKNLGKSISLFKNLEWLNTQKGPLTLL